MATPGINGKEADGLGPGLSPWETSPSCMAKTAQERGLHLSELLTSLMAGRVALNSSEPQNQG